MNQDSSRMSDVLSFSTYQFLILQLIFLGSIWILLSWSCFCLLTLSWPAGHICPTYKESFQVRWDNSIPLFLHAAIYLEVSLFPWTSQNAFSCETAVYKWYCVQCCIAALHTVSFVHGSFAENAFWLVQGNRDTSRKMAAWRKSGILLSQRTWKDSL